MTTCVRCTYSSRPSQNAFSNYGILNILFQNPGKPADDTRDVYIDWIRGLTKNIFCPSAQVTYIWQQILAIRFLSFPEADANAIRLGGRPAVPVASSHCSGVVDIQDVGRFVSS